jgi:catechol 2,3-dioxygenase-like lactoylglutathione lyase family enzyme
MDYKLELVLIPVSDVDRAKKFYLEQAGFVLIVDTAIGGDMRVVQAVPPGSECAIGFGTRAELTERGVSVSEVRHLENGTWVDGPHPERANYESFADFTDPDGNIWILQEVDRSKGQA